MARYIGTFANCTHIIVSLLKAWKVTVVWIECDDAVFNAILRRSTLEIEQGGKLDFINLMLYHWQTLSTSFLSISKDH